MSITREQALDCLHSDDLVGIGMEADAVRRQLHPEGVVTYNLDQTLSLSLPPDTLLTHAAEAIANGSTGIILEEAAGKTLPEIEALLASFTVSHPSLSITGFTATEVLALTAGAGLQLRDTLTRLKDAGLEALSSSAVILVDEVRQRIAPHKCSASEWLDVHRTAHQLGLRSTATMIFGVGESMEQRVHHLDLIRQLQQQTHGFTAFVPLSYEGDTTIEKPTTVEYLKTLAVSRLYLDNIDNIQADAASQGIKVLQMALRFGSNDAGPLATDLISEEELRRIIRDAGFQPAQRDALYRTLYAA
jgi:cyclic dehypoxanthinyl futalosine synthase